jgi:hypothetical protein
MRIMVTETFWLSNAPQTRTGMVSATKELLDRTNGIFPKISSTIFASLKVDNKILGAIEVILKDNLGPDEINQKALMLRTISEVGAQAIQRAMLITKNMKAQRLAAVSKTAIAANHEINSPLTTVLLKLDMLLSETNLSQSAKNAVNEIKKEAITIKNVVKKMLEISDVVETSYTNHEKMLDLKQSSKTPPPGSPSKASVHDQNKTAGFEDYHEKNSDKNSQRVQAANGTPMDQEPGFEDYLENKSQESAARKDASNRASTKTDTPGFEDYLDE